MISPDLARIVCGLPEPTLLVSPEGKILAANQAAGRLLGQTSVELVGRSLISFVTDPEGATQYLHNCLRNSQGIPGGLQLQTSHGRSIQCKAVGAVAQLKRGEACLAWIRLVPRESANNQIVVYNERLQTLSREIKAYQQSEERWRAAFENSAIGIAMTDLEGRFLLANSVYQAMLGYTEEELQTFSIKDITHEGDREFILKLLKELLEGKRQRFQIEKRDLRRDGTVIWVRLNASMVPEKGSVPPYLLGVVEDITERKRAEEERERLRHLQSELAHINRVTTMGELTASIAHEIKQPIAAAHTNAKTCLRWLGRDRPDIEEAREAVSRIIQGVMRASEIINRICVLFKKGEPERECVDVNEVIREMIGLLHSEAARHATSIHTELAPESLNVRADRVQLQQVFMNLILNGIDAINEANVAGSLTIKSQRCENDKVLISISDTGIGLPAEQVDKMFDAFFTTKPKGTGMGLSISRSIIESHGGRLWANGNSDRGATFQFSLPMAVAAQA